MERNKWQFRYPCGELAEAAKKKRNTRIERLKWWEVQKEKVMAEVRASGIEVSESVAAAYSNTKALMGPQVMVRHDLQTKLTECHNKIIEHSTAAREYDGWQQILSNASGERELTSDDWLYFFGEDGNPDNDQ